VADQKSEIGDLKDWIIGLALADGDLCASTPTIACSDEKFAESVVRIANNVFGISAYAKKYGRTWYAIMADKKNQYHSNVFKDYLRELGLLDCKFDTKRLPKNFTLHTLAGFIEGGGCVANNTIRIKNKSLAHDLWRGFQAYRIPSNCFDAGDGVWCVTFHDYKNKLPLQIKKRRSFCNGAYVPRQYLQAANLPKSNMDYQHLCRKRKFIAKRIVDKYLESPHDLWSRVISVKQDVNHHVYDLSIENVHSFSVGGHVVHNCYQEQVMRIAQDLAGYSLAEADGLRKAVGKKIAAKMAENETKFIDGCVANDIDRDTAVAIWEQIKTFAGYGFNKSHSISYSILAYWTAYFKFHYPAEFMAALISSDRDIEKRSAWLEDAKDTLGLRIEPPDINRSQKDFSCQGNTLLFGLSEIKGVGAKAVAHILSVRKRGDFKNIKDFYRRIDLGIIDSGVMRAIIASGAFLRYGFNKPTLIEWDGVIRDRRMKGRGMMERRRAKIEKLQAIIDSRDLSGMPKKYKGDADAYLADVQDKVNKARAELEALENPDTWFKDLEFMPDITLEDSLKMEEEVLGIAVSGNIATPYKTIIKMFGHHSTADCKEPGGGGRFVVCGVLSELRPHAIKSGKYKGMDMMYAKITDLDGSIDVMFFPTTLDKYRELMVDGRVVKARVNKMRDEKTYSVSYLEDAQEAYQEQVDRHAHA